MRKRFHPDSEACKRNKHLIKEKMMTEIFQLINNITNRLLDELSLKTNKFRHYEHYENQGEQLYQLSIAFQNGAKGNLANFAKLNIEGDVKNLTTHELIKYKKIYAIQAYEQFRAACLVADKNKQLSLQVKFRQRMAMCLRLAGHHLEAQLYALSAINLLLNNADLTVTELKQQLAYARDVLKKTQEKVSQSMESPSSNENDNNLKHSTSNTNTSSALIVYKQSVNAVENYIESPSINKKRSALFSRRLMADSA